MANTARADIPQNIARFQRLDIQQGLSQSTITAITQTPDGAIWLGSLNGLNRYDGFSNRVYRPDNSNRYALSDNYITSLLSDGNNLWIGTLNGLSRYNLSLGQLENLSFANTGSHQDNVILSLFMADDKRLWLGTERGLAYFDADTERISYLSAAYAEPINITAIVSHNKELLLGTPQGLKRFNPQTGLITADKAFPLQKASVLTLYQDGARNIWAGLEQQGLYVLPAQQQHWRKITKDINGQEITLSEIRAVVQAPQQNQLWVGSQQGLHKLVFDADNWRQHMLFQHQPYNLSSIGSGKIASLFVSADDTLWAGTWNSGVSRLHQSNNLFRSITASSALMAQLPNPAVINIHSDTDALWLSSAEGLFSTTTEALTRPAAKAGSNNATYYCSTSSEQYIWFGHSNGISRYAKQDGTITELALPEGLPDNAVRRLQYDNARLWIAVDQFGLALVDLESWQLLAVHRMNRSVTFVRPFSAQLMLVGSYAGLHWFDRQTAQFRQQQLLGNSLAQQVNLLPAAPMDYRQDSSQRHWLATNGQGLYQMLSAAAPEQVQFVRLITAEQTAGKDVKALELDNDGHIWLSSAEGISVYSPKQNAFRHFAYRHGTLSRDYINASSAVVGQDSLAFGGMNGYTLFDPQQVLADTLSSPKTPYIKSVLTQPERGGDAIALAPQQLSEVLHNNTLTLSPRTLRSISLEFSGYEYINAEDTEFQYRLDPVDQDWFNRSASERTLMFERLQPGDYTLRLRARLPGSAWSDEARLTIQILPHWWETGWAKALMLMLLALSLLMIHLYRLRRLQQQQQRLEHLVQDRTEQLKSEKDRAEQALQQLESTLSELVQTEKLAALGQLVAGVAHEVNTPLGVALTANSIIGEESVRFQQLLSNERLKKQQVDDYLSKLLQASRLLETNLHRAAQLITNFKQVSVDRTADLVRQFNLNNYLNELMESLSLLWKNKDIVLSIQCPADIDLTSYPGSLGQIITNLTQNAILHAFKQKTSGSISVRCTKKDKKVQIVFTDNGCGISQSDVGKIFDPFFTTSRNRGGTGLGLHIVHNLITQKMAGTIKVSSTPDQGTEFVITLPITVKQP